MDTTTTIQMGAAPRGTLAVDPKGDLYRIQRARRLKYEVMDQDGKRWLIRFGALKPAPEGAFFGGPALESTSSTKFNIGDIVEMASEKDKAKFPGQFVVTKWTTAERVKLQGIGNTTQVTSPVFLIQKVTD